MPSPFDVVTSSWHSPVKDFMTFFRFLSFSHGNTKKLQILELIYTFSRFKGTWQTKVVNSLILVTFQIKDSEGHYLKIVVLRGFT